MKRIRLLALMVLLAAVMLSPKTTAASLDTCPAWFPGYCNCTYYYSQEVLVGVEIVCHDWTWCDQEYPDFCTDVEDYCLDLAYKREWVDWYCDGGDWDCWGACVLGPIITSRKPE